MSSVRNRLAALLIAIIALLPMANVAGSETSLGTRAQAEPFAGWVPLPGSGSRLVESVRQGMARNIPDAKDVQIPKYPNAVLLMIQDYDGEQGDDAGELHQKALVLLSRSEPSEVVEWYRNELVGFLEFIKDDGVLFIDGAGVDEADTTEAMLYCRRHIVIKPIADVIALDFRDYKTSIDIGYFPSVYGERPLTRARIDCS